MGMFDSMNQAPTPQGQVANGSSFAQKTAPMSMRPNPMTGARPALGPAQPMGMRGPRPRPQMGNVPLKPAMGLAPSQQIANPSQGIPNLTPPGDPQPTAQPQNQMNGVPNSIMNAYQSQRQQEPQQEGMTSLYGGRDLQAPPFQGGGNPSFQNMMQGAEFSRPDVMPRGLGPSVVMDENGLEPRRGPR